MSTIKKLKSAKSILSFTPLLLLLTCVLRLRMLKFHYIVIIFVLNCEQFLKLILKYSTDNSLVDYSPLCHKESDRTEHLTLSHFQTAQEKQNLILCLLFLNCLQLILILIPEWHIFGVVFSVLV